jgi:hypothetical protein
VSIMLPTFNFSTSWRAGLATSMINFSLHPSPRVSR